MSIDVQTVSDHANDMRSLVDRALDGTEANKIARIESRPLNLTQFTKKNGRKRSTPQKALTSDDYQTDSSSEGSPASNEQEEPLIPPRVEDKTASILEHYRSFMQRNNVDANNGTESAVRKSNKRLRLTKSVPSTNAVGTENSPTNWQELPAISNGETDSLRSSPSFSDSGFNAGSGLGGLIPERTMRQNNWAIKVWRDWAITRNRKPETKLEKYGEVPVDIRMAEIDVMSYWLPKFIKEVRRKDKKPYPADTLMQIASGLQRYLRQVLCRSEVNFFDKYSNTFAEFREALKCRSGELSLESHTTRGKKISVENLNDDELWQSGFLNATTAKGLFHSVFYYNCVELEVTSMEEHHELKVEQFTISYDKDKRREYLEFQRGDQRYYNMSNKRVMRINASTDDSRCLVKLYKTYLDLIPSMGPFYRRPLQTSDNSLPRFSFNPVGINKLRETFKQLFSSDRPASSRKSGRATALQQMSPTHADHEHTNPATPTSQSSVDSATQALCDAISQKLANSGHLKWRENAVDLSKKNDYLAVRDEYEAGNGSLTAVDVMEHIRQSWHAARLNNFSDAERQDASPSDNSDDVISLKVPQCVRTIVVERGGKKYKFDLD